MMSAPARGRCSAVLLLVHCIMLAALLSGCGGGNEGAGDDDAEQTAAAGSRLPESKIGAALDAAEQYTMAGEFAKAGTILDELVEKAPDDERGFEMLGRVRLQQAIAAAEGGENQQAATMLSESADAYERAMALAPQNAQVLGSGGMVLLQAGRHQAAIDAFTAASDLDPANPQYPLFAAQLHLQKDNTEEARDQLERALAIDPELAHAHASLAMIHLQHEDFEPALERIRTARELNPDEVSFRAQEARIHRHAGNPARSLDLLTGLPVYQRQTLLVAEEIARAYEAMDQPSDAADVWEQAYLTAANAPEKFRSALGAARTLLAAGKRQQALLWAERAAELQPEHAEVEALTEQIRQATDDDAGS